MNFHRNHHDLSVLFIGWFLLAATPLGVGCAADEPMPPVELEPIELVALTDLGVTVTESRPFVYTNKVAAYYYGEAAGPHRTGWQGFNIRGFTFIDDWHWSTEDTDLGSDSFTAATVYPDHAVRRYQGGLSEQITLVDGHNALLVEPDGPGALTMRPLLADGRNADYYDVRIADGALLMARQNHMERLGDSDHPVWLAIKSAGGTPAIAGGRVDAGGAKPTMFSPGTVTLSSAEPVVLAVADTVEDAVALADAVLAERETHKNARAERMQALIDQSYVASEDQHFSRAMAWARIGMDALLMDQRGQGIFAGLPWFNNYWGRDTFISLPGALLVTGQFETARAILTSFSEFQNDDDSDDNYGRVPNFVSLGDVTYNTTDGTPWFAIQAGTYVDYSGDQAFWEQIWPVLERAAVGAERHTDKLGFLTHGDQETWMDAAAGPGQEWSPRGDRAVEIQGLWYEQLVTTARIARALGHNQEAQVYQERADALQTAFLGQFYDAEAGLLIDHFNADGSADAQLRPNLFFALRSFAFDDAIERTITRNAAAALVYPHGVASLFQGDDSFHPFHQAPLYYPKDAAYHNGTVWTWLSGPVVSLMVEQGAAVIAYEQIDYLNRVIVDRGAVGVIAENLDALPREVIDEVSDSEVGDGSGDPNLSGTVYQAWSHAEYLRNVYQDFAGVHYEAFDRVRLQPNLPQAWGRTQIRWRMGDGYVTATMRQDAEQLSLRLRGQGELPASARIAVAAFGVSKEVAIAPDKEIVVVMRPNAIWVDGDMQGADGQYAVPDAEFWADFTWQSPELRAGLPALQGPGWPLIKHEDLKQPAGTDAAVILDVADPTGDDRGPSDTYVYPQAPVFEPGILDATGLEIREDSDAFYVVVQCKLLTQPGWNPHYGFQLTMAALTFDTASGGKTEVGREALYTFPDEQAYEYIIYVGAGLLIEDHQGKVLGEYRPTEPDVSNPLGSADSGQIAFRVPKSIVPALPEGTGVTLLIGGQDDHGGAGLGDFRLVSAEAGDWNGGGKTDPKATNVYDTVTGTIAPVAPAP